MLAQPEHQLLAGAEVTKRAAARGPIAPCSAQGHGSLMRAEWDIARHPESGRLVQVLPQYDTPDADIHAEYPQGHQNTRRVAAFVEFLAAEFASQALG